MRPGLELRMSAGAPELRSADNGTRQIVGYAAVFNREAVIAGNFRERVMPGAFRDALAASDVRGLFNHDPSRVLARSKAGTLRVIEDEIGLRYEIDLNANDPEAMSLAAKVERGDVSGSSFRFILPRDGQRMEPAEAAGQLPLRTVVRISELIDVGPVTFPAYDETTSEARDMAAALVKTDPPATAEPKAEEARAALTAAEGEEAAELVQYQTAASALGVAQTAIAKAAEIAAALIAAETNEPTQTDDAEAAEEEVETAQLRALLVLCSQACGAISGVSALAQAMLSDEYDPILYARSADAADADRSRRLALESAKAEL